MAKDVVRVVAAVIERDGRYLIAQRTPNAVLPLLWEFPGGQVEMDETNEQALIREVEWRIGVTVDIVEKLGDHIHEYESYDVHLAMFACRLGEGIEPRAANVNQIRWVKATELGEYEFPPADEQTMSKLLGLGRDRC